MSGLIFNEVRAKNFRSIANSGMSLNFLTTSTTLIVSTDNGAGKSTMALWAVYYALFGKSYKKGVKLASLINSRSGKDCVVELEFETSGSKWLVRRGQKPAIFDIERDGKRVEDEAALKDYQAYLESVIGMDETAFCFIVALGPDKFVPFCSMSASERRSFVEQILDITIISDMAEIAKADLKEIKKSGEQAFYEIGLREQKQRGHQRTLGILLENKQQRLSASTDELQSLMTEAGGIENNLKRAQEKMQDLVSSIDEESESKLSEVIQVAQKMKSKQEFAIRPVAAIEVLDICPTCKQSVTEEHKHSIRNEAETEAKKYDAPLDKLKTEQERLEKIKADNLSIRDKIAQIKSLIVQFNTKLESIRSNIKQLKEKSVDVNEDSQIDAEKAAIDSSEIEIKEWSEKLEQYKREEIHHNALLGVLKDDAVKSEIVKQYVPFLNQKINEILDSMNLYVQLNMDEEFNVSLFAPDRKGQTIDSLSTGQLRRVDLAILLAWREVSRAKASVSTNLLVLDEILENLSQQGVADFCELWDMKYKDKDVNLVVISQRSEEFSEYFDRVITYSLKDERTVEV